MALTSAVLAALLHRERTGMGQLVEVPMLETLAAFNSIEMLGGHGFSPSIGPAGYKRMKERRPVRTKDGWMTILPYSGDNWATFFTAVGEPQYIEVFNVHDTASRSRNIDKVYAAMREIAVRRTNAEWEKLLLKLDVPHTVFAKLTEIEAQPHLQAVKLFETLKHPTEGDVVQARPATRFSESPASIHRLPAHLGQHTEEVLSEVGYSPEEIEDLTARKVITHARV